MDNFNTQKHDGQGNGGFDRSRRDVNKAQRNAVGNGERSDGFDQHPAATNNEQQGQNKQQVIDAQEDMLDAERGVSPCPFEPGTGPRPGTAPRGGEPF